MYEQGSAKMLWAGFVNAASKLRQYAVVVSNSRNKIHQILAEAF